MPKAGSALACHLSKVHDDVVNHRNKFILPSLNPKSGIKWIAPTTPDPVASGSIRASDYYLNECWIYKWMPTDQFDLDLQCISCPHCKSVGREQRGLEKNKIEWRPMIGLDKITWVLYRRLRCKNTMCRKTVCEIDSSFLSMLPTRIAERFEFVTTLSGPGLHQSLVFLLAPLLEKTVMFGTFTNAVNETHSI